MIIENSGMGPTQVHDIDKVKEHAEARRVIDEANILSEDRPFYTPKSFLENFIIASTISWWANYLFCCCTKPLKKVCRYQKTYKHFKIMLKLYLKFLENCS